MIWRVQENEGANTVDLKANLLKQWMFIAIILGLLGSICAIRSYKIHFQFSITCQVQMVWNTIPVIVVERLLHSPNSMNVGVDT